MDDLVAWLTAQLDDDEQIALAACWDDQSDVWRTRPPQASYELYTVVDYLDDGVVVVTPENADADGVGQHVAAHDPARVLREIDAKRRIVDECSELIHENGLGVGSSAEAMLRALASVYADREAARRSLRAALRRELKRIKARKWRAAKSYFNGYLAEHAHAGTRCGTGWTRGRAYRDLARHLNSDPRGAA